MLLFPVKLARSRGFVLAGAMATLTTACGYRTAYGHEIRGADSFSIGAAPFATPDLIAVQAAIGGARAELGRLGALSAGDTYPEIVVEVLRVDELASGIQATRAPGGPLPLAAASKVGVVARAWIVRGPGGDPAEDTGDVRCVETVAQGADPSRSTYAYDEGVRAAARRVGEILARRVLGLVEPAVEPM